MNTNTTFLPPIEKPEGLDEKAGPFLYPKAIRQGVDPVKVLSARLPAAFGMFAAKIRQLDKKVTLLREMVFSSANAWLRSISAASAWISGARS